MVKVLLKIITGIESWYQQKNRWWIPLLCGFFYMSGHAPFNHETHGALFLFPLFSFVVVIPLLAFSLETSFKRAMINCYLFGITASFTQFYWLVNVMIEGLWIVIILGLCILTLYIALLYLLYGFLYRWLVKTFGSFSIILFPAVWIIVEYVRTLGDMSFPWALNGYALSPVLPIAQLASITGIYGLSFLIIYANIIIWEILKAIPKNYFSRTLKIHLSVFVILVLCITIWGSLRLHQYANPDKTVRISLIQNNIDQKNWKGKISLDTSMAITEKLVYQEGNEKSDLIIFPESGIYCYLERELRQRARIIKWSRSTRVPMILGTLHFERMKNNPYYKYRVFNAVFFLDTNTTIFQHYYKIKLVPFSEGLPFEGFFPLLSRLNLGESDFHRGEKEVIFPLKSCEELFLAPFLCYEIIYPDFVRNRVNQGANILVNLTNDGWFGFSTAPYNHAAMARMRSIENGLSLARCANSGISMFVDPVGRVIDKTKLYERTVLISEISSYRIITFYSRFGNWIIWLSFIVGTIALLYHLIKPAGNDQNFL